MTIERRYYCNLCRETHDPGSGQLVGLYWSGKSFVLKKNARDVEHHICQQCLATLRAEQPA